jgi:hypothetical protein
LTFLGKRLEIYWKEGWKFLPGYPFLLGLVLINMLKKNMDLAPLGVRTPDMAEIEVETALTFQPDKDNLIEYLNSGGEAGVREILDDMVDEAIRELAITKERPPDTWEEAIGMKEDFAFEILLKIRGILIPKDSAERSRLKENNKELLKNLRVGNGTLAVESLGMIINRLNIKNVQPKGKLVEAAEKLAIERRERDAEIVELEHVRARVKELEKDINLSPEQSIELIQTERGKVIKTVEEKKLSVSKETRESLEKIVDSLGSSVASAIVSVVSGKTSKGGDK